MTRIIIFLGIILSAVSCVDKKTPRTNLAFNRVVAADLFTQFPGTLRVASKYILLENPMDKDAFLQVYDRKTGTMVLSTGKIGRGPGEWNRPNISNVVNDRVAVYDSDLNQFIIVNVDTSLNVSDTDSIQKLNTEFTEKFVFWDESQYITATWKETHPFEFFSNGHSFPCGQYSIKETVKNTFDSFQGILQIHPQKGLLVYATIDNPYIALYQTGTNELSLLWENQFKPAQYSITGDGELHWGRDQPFGISDVAFTKDYIVCLGIELNLNEINGRDTKTAPKVVYLFDYDGKLIHICDLPVHSVRLAADTETNMFYSITYEDEYNIVEYDLSSVGL